MRLLTTGRVVVGGEYDFPLSLPSPSSFALFLFFFLFFSSSHSLSFFLCPFDVSIVSLLIFTASTLHTQSSGSSPPAD